MKFDFAIVTTDGETPRLPMPVSIAKVEEVAAARTHFTAIEDELIAAWMLEIGKIMSLV